MCEWVSEKDMVGSAERQNGDSKEKEMVRVCEKAKAPDIPKTAACTQF